MSETTEPSQETIPPPAVSEDKKSIQEEEREKILNEENEMKNAEEKKVVKEGMEVKPKKIPIGGIQMPGFFTRSKSKEQCKEEEQTEGTELIEQVGEKKDETEKGAKLKLPNIFKKNKSFDVEEGDKAAEPRNSLKILDTIRPPLNSVLNRLRRTPENQNLTQPGLASTETLDDKSTEMKNVPLDDKKEEEVEVTWLDKAKQYKIAIGGSIAFFLMIILIVILATRDGRSTLKTPPLRDGMFVETASSCGKIEGKMEDSSFAFRGIPYARPPIGDLRFKYAQPLNRLDLCWNGTLTAHNATPPCLQILPNGTVVGVEDCLTLDIVTPYVRYDNPLPVIVLIGADSFVGGSPGKMRPSARYARSRDVVFVRPNFRMGALGFLALDTLSKSDYPHISGNYALSDILEALKWVQLNIDHFGGDKRQVTLFGHKAGATIVTALATMANATIPKTKDKYFTRAWATSGGALYPTKPLHEAENDFKSFLSDVGCEDAACLRQIDAKKLVTAVQDTWRKPQPDLPRKDEDPGQRHQWMVIDGNILKEAPSVIWTNGMPVKFVMGSTAQAGSTEKLLLKNTNWTEGIIRHHVKESFIGGQNLTDEVLKKYPSTYYGLSTMVTDIRITCPLFKIWSDMPDVSFYVVNQTRNGLSDIDSDIDAILGRYEPKTPDQRRYFSAMQGLFYHFVWHGKVEQKSEGKNVQIVDQDVLNNKTYSHCQYWIDKGVVMKFAALD